MRHRFWIAAVIAFAALFLSACNRPLDLAGNLDGSTKELTDLVQVGDLLLGNADSKEDNALAGSSHAEPTTGAPTPTPGPGPTSVPEDSYVYTGPVEYISPEVWFVGAQQVTVSSETVIIGEIQVGDWAQVSGYLENPGNEGSVIAREIRLVEGSVDNVIFYGEVEFIDDPIWIVRGHEVLVSELTEINGEIRLNDRVRVSGGLNEDGIVVALEISLISRDAEDVEFIGLVKEIGEEIWQIAEHRVLVDEHTEIEGVITVGDRVKVEGSLLHDGRVWAHKITLLSKGGHDREVEFTGRVHEMGKLIWIIGDHRVLVTPFTKIEGDISIGALVKVHGVRWFRGIVVAREIQLLERGPDLPEVEFTGHVQEMGERIWLIGDRRVLVTERTVIEGDIQVGDLVKVQGYIGYADLVVARKITLLERLEPVEVEFIGRVKEMGERFWLIGDHRVLVTEQTEIIGDIQVGDLVRVRGFQRDGVIVARQIKLLERPDPIEVEFIGRVKEMGERFWLIGDHRVLVTEQTEIIGDIQVGDLVRVRGFQRDGVIVARQIKLLERPDPIEVEFTGHVQEMGERFWLVGDHRVRITERTRIEGEIEVGHFVQVRGTLAFDGVVVASEIKLVAVIDRVSDGEDGVDVSTGGD